MSGVRINFGQTITATKDYDGYPAVRIQPSDGFVWTEDEVQWITASGESADLEDRVRDLAAALVEMADAMGKMREDGA